MGARNNKRPKILLTLPTSLIPAQAALSCHTPHMNSPSDPSRRATMQFRGNSSVGPRNAMSHRTGNSHCEYLRSGWRHLQAAYAFVPNAISAYAYPETHRLKQILQTRSNRAHHKGACHFRSQKRYLVSGTDFDPELFVSIYLQMNQLHSSVALYNDVPASSRRCADLGARSLFDKSCLAHEKMFA